MRDAAGTVKKISLELGGKSPNIVYADADLDAAARGALTGIFYGKGEVCAAGSRLLVERPIHDTVVAKLVERAQKTPPGDPMHPKTRLGAQVRESRDRFYAFCRSRGFQYWDSSANFVLARVGRAGEAGGEVERAPPADFTLDPDVATHQSHELGRDCQTQTQPAEALGDAGVGQDGHPDRPDRSRLG